MTVTKHARYASHSAELERANVRYEPIVWSCFGRPHPQTLVLMKALAKRAARRRGLSDPQQLVRRSCAKITCRDLASGSAYGHGMLA